MYTEFSEFLASPELQLVLQHEGGDKCTNDPADPGGCTKYGISLRAYPHLGVSGIQELTREQASLLYWNDYYCKYKCNALPRGIALLLFDACVNQGGAWSTRALQTAVGCKADGVIGTVTVRAVQAAGLHACIKFSVARAIRYCMSSTGFRENFKRFGKGWLTRLFETFAVAVACD